MSKRNRREFWLFYEQCDECDRVKFVAYGHPPWPKEEGTHVREVLPGEITLTREEFRVAFAKAYATPENANKRLDGTLGLAIERMLFESEGSEK